MKTLKKRKELESKVAEQAMQIAKLEGLIDGIDKGMTIIIKDLQKRIEVLEFLRNNPSGIRLTYKERRDYNEPISYGFEYVKGNEVKRAFMDESYRSEDVGADVHGNTITIYDIETGSVRAKVEFDINNERFVYIREVKSERND